MHINHKRKEAMGWFKVSMRSWPLYTEHNTFPLTAWFFLCYYLKQQSLRWISIVKAWLLQSSEFFLASLWCLSFFILSQKIKPHQEILIFSLCTALADLRTPDVFVCPQIQAELPIFHHTLQTGITTSKSFKQAGVNLQN